MDSIKLDKKKNKYYLVGKVIQMEGYPRYHTLAFISDKNVAAFNQAKTFIDKKKFVQTVLFGHIDYLTVMFDSLDWIK